jgi:hypothetical protein
MMLFIRLAFVIVAAVTLEAQAPSAPPAPSAPAPAGAFRFERPVQPAGPGPNRLTPDVPLLVGAAPIPQSLLVRTERRVRLMGGLSDVRLFDQSGREVPYLLVPPPPSQPIWTQGSVLPLAIIDRTDGPKTSGFEGDLGAVIPIDRFEVTGIPAPFLKRAVVEGSGDREHWTMLVAEGTLFDLPREQLRKLEFEFRAGEYRYVRVTWDDTNSGHVPLPTRVAARRVPNQAPQITLLTTQLVVERRPSEPRRSRFRVQLPGAHLPIAQLQLDVDNAYLMRQATVFEARFDGRQLQPVPIGSALLKRVTKDSLRADELSIPINAPQTGELELVVDDADNPPLVLKSLTAVFAELPTIYFESDSSPLIARYGDASVSAPRYDLEAARPTIVVDAVASATWGTPTANTTGAAAAAPPMPSTGTTLDQAVFEYARPIPSSATGLTSLALDTAVLAHGKGAGGQFSDVRVLDASGRQIPYVMERREEPLTLPLTMQRLTEAPEGVSSSARGNQSWYTIQLPYEKLPPGHFVIETNARVFQRSVSVMTRAPAADPLRRGPALVSITSAAWVAAKPDVAPPALSLEIGSLATRELYLAVNEGDNTPLPIERVSMLLPAYRVRFFRPEGAALTLVYGRNDLSAPQYDLALLAPQVLSAAATEVAAEPEGGAPQPSSQQVPLVSPLVFWAALGVALAVLLGIIVRLLRSQPVTM